MRQRHRWARDVVRALLVVHLLGVGAYAAAKPGRSTDASIFLDLQPLTKQQRLDDFAWIVSNFEEFYAPLNYKESRWDFDWRDVVARYRERISKGSMSHQKFAALMQQFVSEVHDGHTSLTTWREASMAGGDMRVSTLGFHTTRMLHAGEDAVYVAAILPNFFAGKSTPVQVGDQIVAIDGRSVETILQEDLQPYQTTGREDSDATMLARSLAFRVGTMWPMRPHGPAQVTLIRGQQVFDIDLAWVDVSLSDVYHQERDENQDAQSAPAALVQSKVVGRTQDNRWIVQTHAHPGWRHVMQAEQSGYAEMEHQFAMSPQVALFNAVGRKADNDEAGIGMPITVDGLTFRLLKTQRGLAAVYRVEDFVYSRMRCGQPSSMEAEGGLAYLLCDELSGEDYAQAFNKLEKMGVTDLVLDLRHNGGGMLTFSDNLLRAFSHRGIPAQTATVRVNESWLGNFVALAANPRSSLAQRSVYQSQEKTLRRDIARKRRISRPVHLEGTKTLAANPYATHLRTFVLIDELCASACDLFAASMQDNKLGTILGRQSMGAGGNVVRVGDSPHEKLALTQTASLIYRADGSFVENEGVKPDIEIPSHVDAEIWALVTFAIEEES